MPDAAGLFFHGLFFNLSGLRLNLFPCLMELVLHAVQALVQVSCGSFQFRRNIQVFFQVCHGCLCILEFLFQTDKFGGKDVAALMSDPELSGIMEIMAGGLGVDIEQAREMFLTFFCVAHGMASLLANNSMVYDEEQCKKMLENVFFGMIAARKGT